MSFPHAVYVLIVREDGTALELRGKDACSPWERVQITSAHDWLAIKRQPPEVAWNDGRASWRVLEAARTYRSTPVDAAELERARMDLVALARLLPEGP